MSGGLAPSKSTVYVSNLPFSLTNSDLHKIFDKYGRVVKVTILKDKFQRKSRGVAFVLFLDRESAYKCVRAVNNTEMFGRTLKCSIAKDNGRTTEFIRRKEYKDKSRCYECGESGHLSFQCPKNLLGHREPPVKKKKKDLDDENNEGSENDDNSGGEDLKADSLAAAIQYEQEKIAESAFNYNLPSTSSSLLFTDSENQRKKYKKDAYFSDEEELD